MVYWSTNYVGFNLQSASPLPAAGWTTVAGPYYLAGGFYEYAESRAALQSQKYFRLAYTGVTIVSPGPTLSLQVETNSVIISWPANFAGFTLESKTNLAPAIPWSPVPGPYLINGADLEYRQSAPALNGSSFYRLRGP